ncbi:hypothetical protein DAPPUDRAFT_109400 [Daphnia pulex]|uniref:Uncharacterized protein n=1 Tax=Daphnia pulex TaxID=6669 RepID=E9H2Y0_DAPPU|nr:hypothetical protein DAPPUDRAFT_109400 [Daphnia pulex]|eukprot:EFX73865.1 hypothetical protein DAPPUDRAFT_109400 [Daphnia pulex]
MELITAKTTPKEAFSFHAEFSRFSMAFFSNNFRQLKLLNGLEYIHLYPVAVIDTKKKLTLDDAAGCSSSNSSALNSTKRSRFEEDEDVVEDDLEDRDSRITFHNYPLLIDIYED